MINKKHSTALCVLGLGIVLLSACANQTQDKEKDSADDGTTAPVTQQAPAPAKSPQQRSFLDRAESLAELSHDSQHSALEEVMVTANRGSASDRRINAREKKVSSSGMNMSKLGALMPQELEAYRHAREVADNERYDELAENAIKVVSETPVSTFSIDVDTASYSNVRRMLNQGRLPRHDAVRVEEFINYFSYDYPKPKANAAFSSYTEIGPSPWAKGKHLLHIGLQGYAIAPEQRPSANLVFLLDVSGSMNVPNKLPLLKSGLKMLVKQLRKDDSVGIVVYAGAAGVVLKPSSDAAEIVQALEQLSAGGSTNGGAGINAAYTLAQSAFKADGINRIILCTDGDFNVGTVNQQALKDLIREKRQSGIGLTVLGFGMGNYNDAFAQTLAQNGNGNAYYIDTLREARKVLVDELSATLQTIAKDVKIQIEFNPATVAEYRLVGYESRMLRREDFNNDKVDAGEIGAGHTVTALYEITLNSSAAKANDPLRYASKPHKVSSKTEGELAFLRLRYKQPDASNSTLLETPIHQGDIIDGLENTSDNFRFSAAVAAFAQLLKGSPYTGTFSYQDVLALAEPSRGSDRFGYRSDLLQLVRLAETFAQQRVSQQNNANQTTGEQQHKHSLKALAAQL